MNHIGLFEGIGGFSLAARWMGWNTIAWCEWNEFGQKVLKHHFPNAKPHGDITKTDFTIYRGQCDILTGGFPCQPYSSAGKRLGKEDERHLWPEMLRAIREIQPGYVVGENVRGLTNWNEGVVFDEVQADLEAEGYEVLPFLLPACAVNAPHRRERIFFVAYADKCTTGSSRAGGKVESNRSKNNDEQGRRREPTKQHIGCSDVLRNVTDTINEGLQRNERLNQNERTISPGRKSAPGTIAKLFTGTDWRSWPTQPPVCGGDDGLPTELDGITFSKWRNESIKAYGNAIVPQVAYQIFKAIEQYENDQN